MMHFEVKASEDAVRVIFKENDHIFFQYPVITEKFCVERSIPAHCIFLHVPWATIIDIRRSKRRLPTVITKMLHDIDNEAAFLAKKYSTETQRPIYTACQHIGFRDMFATWQKLGVSVVYASHFTTQAKKEAMRDYDIVLLPLPLFAASVWNMSAKEKAFLDSVCRKDFLFSFVGSCKPNDLDQTRKTIVSWAKNASSGTKSLFFIRDTKSWFFQDVVYDEKNNGVQKRGTSRPDDHSVIKYNNILKRSFFSLCPVGSGPNTIRFWESLALGAIPVLFGSHFEVDHFLQPLGYKANEVCILLGEIDPSKDSPNFLVEILNDKNSAKIKDMTTKGQDLMKKMYNKGFFV